MRVVLSRSCRGELLFACCASLALAGSLGVCASAVRAQGAQGAQSAQGAQEAKNTQNAQAQYGRAPKDQNSKHANNTAPPEPAKDSDKAAPAYRLGLMQLESDAIRDDEAASALMEELLQALSQRGDFDTVDTHVTLTQLSLVEDCNITELGCLAQIAEKMKLDGFVSGKLTHETGQAPVAAFRRYDKRKAAIQSTALVSLGSTARTPQALRNEAVKLVGKLIGPTSPTVGGSPVAQAESSGRGPQSAQLAVRTTDTVPSDAQLDPSDGLNMRKFAGYVLLGGAAASVGLSVFSFVQVDRASNNPSFQEYRAAVGMSNADVKDVCDEARANQPYGTTPEAFKQVKSSCSTGTTFEVLQYVFIGSALVTGGLATFFLFGGDDSSDSGKGERAYITLHPSIGRGGGSFTARMNMDF